MYEYTQKYKQLWQHKQTMPTFDFTCQACDSTFEFTRSFGSTEHPACPHCKSKDTEKLMHTPNIAFKGSGFYKTDSSPAKETATSEPAAKSKNKTEG